MLLEIPIKLVVNPKIQDIFPRLAWKSKVLERRDEIGSGQQLFSGKTFLVNLHGFEIEFLL